MCRSIVNSYSVLRTSKWTFYYFFDIYLVIMIINIIFAHIERKPINKLLTHKNLKNYETNHIIFYRINDVSNM